MMREHKADILVVDDTPANLQLLVSMLEERGYTMRPALNGRMALEAVQAAPPDLILLDINMPQMNGYEVCLQLKEHPETKNIPVIFISAYDEVMDKVMAFNVGGVDYITKPFQVEEVLARVQTHLELRWRQLEIERLREWERSYLEQIINLKDDVLRMASHDMKNPLSTIMSAAYFLREQTEGNEAAERYLTMIERGVERMSALIHDLLDLAQIEGKLDIKHEPVALKPFLEDNLMDALMEGQRRGIQVKATLPPPDFKIKLSPNRFSQVIQNLLSNAIKYTPKGGQVEFWTERRAREVWFFVRDTGLGIPENDLPHIFEKFYRVQTIEHSKIKGTGLGLAIVKALVEQHQGRIWAESVYGQGSTFVVVLPLD